MRECMPSLRGTRWHGSGITAHSGTTVMHVRECTRHCHSHALTAAAGVRECGPGGANECDERVGGESVHVKCRRIRESVCGPNECDERVGGERVCM
jgi:hypothetical protein